MTPVAALVQKPSTSLSDAGRIGAGGDVGRYAN